MPLYIINENIVKMKVDAIVNAANTSLLGGGGVDGAIHAAAGSRLLEECRKLNGCDVGMAKITKGYKLPARYVIHTVGPIWDGGQYGEKELLESCYRESLNLAVEYNIETIAFPLISSGVYGYPKDKALEVAITVISEFLDNHNLTAYIVIYNRSDYRIDAKLLKDVSLFVDERQRNELMPKMRMSKGEREEKFFSFASSRSVESTPCCDNMSFDVPEELNKKLKERDMGFSEALLKLIDQKGLTDAQCYKKANIDRKLFSKIRSTANYRPKKNTVIAFAIALELTLSETEDLLKKAGYALSDSNTTDIIIEYFIENKIYNIFTINEVLFAFDQSLLGA